MNYTIYFYENDLPDVYVNGELAILRGKTQHMLARGLYDASKNYVHLKVHDIEVRYDGSDVHVSGCTDYSYVTDYNKNGHAYARVVINTNN